MAARAKDSTAPSRERKSSTSPPAATRTKRHTTKPTTPDKPAPTSTSPSTTKPVPNYLKSTASSSRPTPDSSSLKPTLNRRRSFDKPPSPSRQRKSLISPGKESTKEAPLRSKSFTAKTATTAPKPGPKTGPGTKSQALYAKNSGGTSSRRSTSGVTSGVSKKESGARSTNGGSKAPKSQHITEILNLEANLDDSEVGDVDKIESIEEDNSEDLPDPKVSEEDHDVDHHHQSDADQAKSPTGHDTSSEHEISSVKDVEEHSKPTEDAKPEEVIQEEKTSDVQQDQVEEINHVHEGSEEGSGLAGEERKAEEVIKDKKKSDEVEMAVVDGGSAETDAKEEQEGDVKEEGKAEEAAAKESAKPRPAQAAKNKKEAAHGAYNDVIEETASKLMASDQKRKNKVLALVGAFETVIDYETAAGGSK